MPPANIEATTRQLRPTWSVERAGPADNKYTFVDRYDLLPADFGWHSGGVRPDVVRVRLMLAMLGATSLKAAQALPKPGCLGQFRTSWLRPLSFDGCQNPSGLAECVCEPDRGTADASECAPGWFAARSPGRRSQALPGHCSVVKQCRADGLPREPAWRRVCGHAQHTATSSSADHNAVVLLLPLPGRYGGHESQTAFPREPHVWVPLWTLLWHAGRTGVLPRQGPSTGLTPLTSPTLWAPWRWAGRIIPKSTLG